MSEAQERFTGIQISPISFVDEGVDTDTDVANCGSCGNACVPDNAFPTCTAGVCGL